MKKQKQKTNYKKIILTFIIAFCIALIALTVLRVVFHKAGEQNVFTPDEGLSIKENMTPVYVDPLSPFYDAYTSPDRVNILLVGVADKNTDTIMVASYDTVNQKIDIISVPRDTYYARDGYKNYAYNKINSIYRTEDILGLVHACSELLYGLPIEYYAIVEYSDIRKVMDAIGGVYVDVPFRMKYDDPTAEPPLHIDIPKGHTLIDSSNVEQYLRFRHGNEGYASYRNGDLGRIEAQQAFVKLVAAKCLKAGNIVDVAQVALQNIQSDITYAAVAQLAKNALGGLSSESISTYRLPGYDATLHNLSFWMPDDVKVFEMLEDIFNISSEEPVSDTITSDSAVSGAAIN